MEVKFQETANPGPLGLVGFGLTTILLNLHNAGFFALDASILSMGIFVGGLMQVIVGIFEWKKNNMFGMMAFTSYGFFWISLVALILMPNLELSKSVSSVSMGWYLIVWALFTFGLFIVTLKMNTTMKILFALLLILFILLAIGDFSGIRIIKIIAGFDGIICGLTAIYLAFAQLINHEYDKIILPI